MKGRSDEKRMDIIPYCELPIGFRQWVVHSDITQLDINCRNIYVHTLMPRLKFI